MTTSNLLEKAIGHSIIALEGQNKQFLLFDNIRSIASEWQQLPIERIFMSVPYLETMEKSGLQDTQTYYGILTSGEMDIQACFYYHVKLFKAEESIHALRDNDVKGLKKLRQRLKSKLASQITFTTLVQGNLSISGPFGHWISSELEKVPDLIFKAARSAFSILQSVQPDLKAILLKDYYTEFPYQSSSFAQFEIQPAMEMKLDTQWSDFENYIDKLRSKYRVRYRKARERVAGIERTLVLPEQLSERDLSRIYELYKKRASVSDFNIATLHQDYFRDLNAWMPEDCRYWIYRSKGEIIAFMCMLAEPNVLHAHFTGYDEVLNNEHDLYLNLLYDVVSFGIDKQVKRICFARTAMEIKSGVGANPRQLYCYMYYDSTISQLFIPSIVKYLEPKKDWNNRQPFKS